MSFKICCRQDGDGVPKRGKGFVLVVSLLTMGFVLLVALGVLVQLRIQADLARKGILRLEARETARLGMMMALGQLQHAAGPDQRVTARAELLGPAVPDAQRHWAGVWKSSDVDAPPVWLVSGDPGDPAGGNASLEEWITVLAWPGPDPGSRRVVMVPGIQIDSGGVVANRLGWWVSDEGVKASLAKFRPVDELANWDAFSPRGVESLISSTPARCGADLLLTSSNADDSEVTRDWDDLLERIGKGVSKETFPIVLPEAETEFSATYHALTWNSFGVLSDCMRGGLRKDLTHPNTPGAGVFEDPEGIRSIVGRWIHGPDSVEMKGHAPDRPLPGSVGLATPALIHECGLYLGVFRENTGPSTRLKLHLTLRVEVWNPHSAPLEMTERAEPDLHVIIKGLPRFNVSWRTGVGEAGEAGGDFTFSVSSLQFREDRGGGIITDIEGAGIPVDLHGDLGSADIQLRPARFNASLGVVIPDATSGGDDFVAIRAEAAEVDIELRTADGELLQAFEEIPFEAFSSDLVREQELLPVYGSASPAYADHQAVFHFRFLDDSVQVDEKTSSVMERWFSRFDIREPQIDFSGTREDSISTLIDVDRNPGENIALQTNFFMGDPELFNGGNFIRAFDLPLSPIVSIGWLQHLHFINERPFSIGNPWGGIRNEAFDAFFLSGYPFDLPEEAIPDTIDRLPNPHLVAVPGVQDLKSLVGADESAGGLLVSGSFNINSTSVDAWRALLASHQLSEWTYREGYAVDPVTRPRVKNGVFRFPQGARLHYKSPFTEYAAYPEVSQLEKAHWYKLEKGEPDWLKAFDVGMRELRGDDVDALAQALVDLQMERSEPFPSLAAFVNSGIVQDAIDRTAINSVAEGEDAPYAKQGRTGDAMVFPRYAPSFLSQADVLSTFAPILSARSDTFLIRVRGQVYGFKKGEVASEALCEALVQRFPEALDPADPERGRRFKIIAFRWLDSDQS